MTNYFALCMPRDHSNANPLFYFNPVVKLTGPWIDMEWFTPFDEAMISPK